MIRVIVGRSEVDLQQIKTKYAALYHSHLAERLQEARATLPQSYTFLIGLLNGNR